MAPTIIYPTCVKTPLERIEQTLREALRAQKTLSAVSRATDINESALSRFVRGERGLNLRSTSDLCLYLGLELVNIRFINSINDLTGELEEVVNNALVQLKIIGSPSQVSPYFAAIEKAVVERDVLYSWLMDGGPTQIPPEAHAHLSNVLSLPQVRVRRTHESYFTTFMLTDKDCIVIPPKGDVIGTRATGYGQVLRYTEYFNRLFELHAHSLVQSEQL